MGGKIRTLLFGSSHECRAAAEILMALDLLSEHSHEHLHTDDLEEYERSLVDWTPTLLVILADGTEGMECVCCARERRPAVPVFWFSDDQSFGIQAFGLDCAYFSTKPVTPDKIQHAIHRCAHVGIQLEAV